VLVNPTARRLFAGSAAIIEGMRLLRRLPRFWAMELQEAPPEPFSVANGTAPCCVADFGEPPAAPCANRSTDGVKEPFRRDESLKGHSP